MRTHAAEKKKYFYRSHDEELQLLIGLPLGEIEPLYVLVAMVTTTRRSSLPPLYPKQKVCLESHFSRLRHVWASAGTPCSSCS